MFWIYFIAILELLVCYIIWNSTLVRDSRDEEWHRVPIPRWQVIFSVVLFCIPIFNWLLIVNWGIIGIYKADYKYVTWRSPKIAERFNKFIFNSKIVKWFNKPMFK